MDKTKDAYLPLFVGDFFGSTLLWTGAERGLYLQLLAIEWSNGPLPADLPRLAQTTGYPLAEFELLWITVGKKFVNGDGLYRNAKLERVRVRSEEIQVVRKAASILGVEARRRNADQRKITKQQPQNNQMVNPTVVPKVEPEVQLSDLIRSDLIGAETEKAKKAVRTPVGSKPPTSEPEWFTDYRSRYPQRAGDQNWWAALRAGNARIAEGHTEWQILAGADRYAAFIRHVGKERTEYVKQASSFLGRSKAFLEPWDLPATKGEAKLEATINASQDWLADREANRDRH